jgi:hypothetical protein
VAMVRARSVSLMLPRMPHQKDHLGRYRTEVGVGDSRVRGADLDVRSQGSRGPPGAIGDHWVSHEHGADPLGVATLGQHLQHIATVTGAATQDADRSGIPVECLPEVALDRAQPSRQVRGGVVVAAMPLLVVAQSPHPPNQRPTPSAEQWSAHRMCLHRRDS